MGKESWNKKLCVLMTVMLLIPLAQKKVFSNDNVRINESKPEEVYVDIIGEDERSTLFNDNWKFHRGEATNAQDHNYNDSNWDTVNLPHDYSIDQDYTASGEAESGFLPGGVGWYRKTFVVPKKYDNKQFTIEFDGAYMNAEVYLNGTKLGIHPYGYTAFAFDITDALICDGQTDNVLVVKTNNKIPSSRWYSGSGIYRDVILTVTDKVHVGYNGTKVIAKNLDSNKNGTVKVDVTARIENDEAVSKNVIIKNTLLDKNGNVASSTVSNEVELAAKSTKNMTQEISITSPHLWSVKDSYLYTVKTEIVEGNKVLDTYKTDYGFRYYSFNNNTGFSLNGENIKLKGVCMHHDQGSLGAVASRDAIERQVKMLKEMGCNAIRVTHNPAASALIDICNEYGILVINEAFDGWSAYKNGNVNDYSAHFNETMTTDNQIINGKAGMKWSEFDVKAMVDNGKNDPSVIMWSIGNELDEGVSGGDVSNYVNIAADLIKWIQEVDTTRPVTNGDNRKNTDPNGLINKINQKISDAGGVVGLNYANNDQTKSMHNTFTDWPVYGSETASAVHSRGIYNVTGQDVNRLQMSEYDNDEAKVGWGHSAHDAWKFVIENDFNAGEFVWTGFDYIGEPTPWNGTAGGSVSGQGAKPKSSYFGIMDTAGFTKDTYYLYKSMWNESKSTLHLMSTWNDSEIVKRSNGKVKVDVFTNATKVELYLNGNKVGEDTATVNTTNLGYKYQTFSNGKFYPSFDVTWESGTLSAKAYDVNGNLIHDTEGRNSITTNTAATHLDVTADKKEIKADGSSLSYITVDVKDNNGNIVSGASHRINFNIEGNGKIVGVDNGDPTDLDSYKANSRKAFSGKALVIVQSTKDAGEFTLTASSDNLSGSSVSVKTRKNDVAGSVYLQSYTISKNLYVGIGETPNLPTQVIATYSNGDKENLNVTWNTYDKELLNKNGEFKVTGSLENSAAIATITVHVIGKIVAIENHSTLTSAGIAPKLPQTLRGLYEDGNYSEAFPVKWNISNDTFKNEGIVTVKGTVSVLDTIMETTSTVRVTAKLPESINIVSKNNSDAPTFTNGKMVNGVPSTPSSTAINDSLAELNNGVTNEATSENARWTNWSLRDENPPVDTYVQLQWQKEYTMQSVKLWHFIDSQFSVLPGDKNVRFEYFDKVSHSWKEIESSHITQVPYTAGDTPYGFIHPITTSQLRVWMKSPTVGKCIGLTEIEVYDYTYPEEAKTSAKLDRLELNGTVIKDFDGYQGYDESSKIYTVKLDTMGIPPVIAQANNNESINVLPIYDDEIKIIVRSEDGKTTEVYKIQFILPIQKDKLKNYIESETIKNVLTESHKYTEQSFKEFKKFYDKTIEILNSNTVTQEEVDSCYDDLQNVYKNLIKIVDTNSLKLEIDKAEGINKNQYTVSSVKLLEDALVKAKDIYANKNSTQVEVDDAKDALIKALNGLVNKPEKPSVENIVLKNENSSVIITGQLPKDIQLSSKSLNKEEIRELIKKINKNNPQFLDKAMLEKVYDLELLFNGIKYNLDGSVTVTLRIEDSMKNKNLGIVYIDENGNLTKIDSIVDNDYIQFKAKHFSKYAIVSYKTNKEEGVGTPSTSDHTNVISSILMMSVVSGIYMIMRKKTNKTNA